MQAWVESRRPMQEAVSMLFQSELASEPLLLQQSHEASPKVREFVRIVPSKQVVTPGDEGEGDNSFTTWESKLGVLPNLVWTEKCILPRVATDHQSLKREENQVHSESNWTIPGSRSSWLALPSQRGLVACPKRERIGAWHTFLWPGFTPKKPGAEDQPTATSNDSQERGNQPCALSESWAGVNRMAWLAGFRKKQRLRVTLQIGWRADDCLEGRGASQSQNVMNTVSPPMYGWNTLLSMQVYKLSKHISQAFPKVPMTTAKQLRSRMRRKVHVRFWSRAAGVTPSLRLTYRAHGRLWWIRLSMSFFDRGMSQICARSIDQNNSSLLRFTKVGHELYVPDTTTRADDATRHISRASPSLPLSLEAHCRACSTPMACPSSCGRATGKEATLCDLGRDHWSSLSSLLQKACQS